MMQTNTTGGPHDRDRSWKAPAEAPHRPACATGKDIIAQTLVRHWAMPHAMDGNGMWVRCGDEECDFQSSRVALVGEEGAWAEHAYHVADLLGLAGIGELPVSQPDGSAHMRSMETLTALRTALQSAIDTPGAVTKSQLAALLAKYPVPDAPADEDLVIHHGILSVDLRECTCVASEWNTPEGCSHEDHCGLKPLLDISLALKRGGYSG
jgi:hypothetical protein